MRRFLPPFLLVLCSLPAARGDEASAVSSLRRLGATVERDEKAPGKPAWRVYVLSRRPGQFALLKELPNLRELGFTSDFGDEDLAGLPELKGLELLSLSYSRIHDEGLKHVAVLKNLRKLSLANTAVTDAGLARLAGLEKLQEIDLTATNVGGAGLAGLTGLVAADLKEPRARDADLAALAKLRNLERLDLTRTAVSDKGMGHLAALPNLRELHLSGSLVGPAGLARLATAPALQSLSLPGGSPAGEVVKALAGSRSIRRVSFSRGGLTEEAVAALAAAKKLHWLQSPAAPGRPAAASQGELRSLSLNYATGRLVPHLKALDKLTALGLAGAQLGAGDLAILAGMRRLERLDLANARGAIDDQGMALIAGMPSLRRLDVSGSPLTAKGLGKLAALTELEYLGAARIKGASKALAALVAGLKGLRVLQADRTVTFADLMAAGPPPRLESVAANASQLTDDELRGLAKAGKLAWLYGNDAGILSDPPVKLPSQPLLRLQSPKLSPKAEALPEDVGDVKGLNFSGGRRDDDGLKRVAKLKSVEVLHLSQTAVTDAGMKHLAKMKSLRQVFLYNTTKLTAEGIRALAASDSLRYLSGSSLPIDDGLLAELTKRKRLHVLSSAFADGSRRPETDKEIHTFGLVGRGVTAAGLKTTAEALGGLRNLYLGNCPEAMDGLAALQGLKSLDRLDVAGVQLAPAQVAGLGGHPSLRYLALQGMKMSPELLDALAKLDRLEVLFVGFLAYPPDQVGRLEKFKHLKRLDGLVSPTDELLEELVRIGKPHWAPGAGRAPFGPAEAPADVRVLRLGLTNAKTETLAALFKALPRVEVLSASLRGFKDADVPFALLRRLRTVDVSAFRLARDLVGVKLPEGLERLTVRPYAINDRLLQALAERKMLHVLSQATGISKIVPPPEEALVTKLDLRGAKVGDAGLKSLKALTGLEHLVLSETRVTDAGLDELKALPALRLLEVDMVKGVTRKKLAELRKAMPGLVVRP